MARGEKVDANGEYIKAGGELVVATGEIGEETEGEEDGGDKIVMSQRARKPWIEAAKRFSWFFVFCRNWRASSRATESRGRASWRKKGR